MFLYLLGKYLCLFFLFILMCLGWPVYSVSLWNSLYCGVSSLWVGLYRWLVKVSWLGKLVLVFWWVELDFFSLECNEVPGNELGDANGFGVTWAACTLKLRACSCVAGEFK